MGSLPGRMADSAAFKLLNHASVCAWEPQLDSEEGTIDLQLIKGTEYRKKGSLSDPNT